MSCSEEFREQGPRQLCPGAGLEVIPQEGQFITVSNLLHEEVETLAAKLDVRRQLEQAFPEQGIQFGIAGVQESIVHHMPEGQLFARRAVGPPIFVPTTQHS